MPKSKQRHYAVNVYEKISDHSYRLLTTFATHAHPGYLAAKASQRDAEDAHPGKLVKIDTVYK